MAIPVIGGAGFLTFLDSVNDFSISFPGLRCITKFVHCGHFGIKVVTKLAWEREISLFWYILHHYQPIITH